jgi:hypothetical protein
MILTRYTSQGLCVFDEGRARAFLGPISGSHQVQRSKRAAGFVEVWIATEERLAAMLKQQRCYVFLMPLTRR